MMLATDESDDEFGSHWCTSDTLAVFGQSLDVADARNQLNDFQLSIDDEEPSGPVDAVEGATASVLVATRPIASTQEQVRTATLRFVDNRWCIESLD